MDTLIGVLAIGLAVAFLVWIARASERANARHEEPLGTAYPEDYAPRPSAMELARRAAGIEFLLKESRSDAWMAIPAAQRAELIARYEEELSQIRAARAAPPPAVPRAAKVYVPQAPAHEPMRAPAAPVAKTPAVPPKPAPKPRKPRDWSWLAEQQASLFLFAGAFLVVVAALIYVGYSGQALSGTLKVALLAAYTIAFLVAGIVCYRIALVRVAGLVFIAISAVLVPLNFVLAGSVIEADFSDEGMWLAGSFVSGAFYASVGGLGLGHQYSFAAGVALASAAGAAVLVLGLPVGWAPAPFLALAVAIAAVEAAAPQTFRERVARIWTWQAHVITVLFLAYALAVAIAIEADQDAEDLPTRWVAAPMAVLGLAFYAVRAIRGSRMAVTGFAVTLSALTSSIVFGFDLSPEYYAFSLIGAGLVLAAAVRSPLPRLAGGFIHSVAATDVLALAHLATAGGVAVAIAATVADADPDSTFALDTRWTLLGAFAAAALVHATHLSMRMPALGEADLLATFGLGLSIAGVSAAVVYGANWSPEYYAFAAVAAAAVLLTLANAGLPKAFGEGPPSMQEGWLFLAQGAAITAACVAAGAVYATETPEATYEPETLWTVPVIFGALAVFYALAVWSPFRPALGWGIAAGLGLAGSVAGLSAGTVYALEISPEYYAFAASACAAILLALATWGLPSATGEDPPEMRTNWLFLAHAASLTAGSVAAAAVYATERPDATYAPDTLWFAPALLGALAVFYVLAVWSPFRPAPVWGIAAGLGLAASVAGLSAGTVYALEISAEYYAFAAAASAAALLALATWGLPSATGEDPPELRGNWLWAAHTAGLTAASVAVGAVYATEMPEATYEPDTLWFLPALFGLLVVFYGLALWSSFRPSQGWRVAAGLGLVASVFGVTTGLVYALEISAEYYAFAVLGPAIVLGALAHLVPVKAVDGLLPDQWRAGAIACGRAAAVAGLSVAVIAAISAADPDVTYEPDTRIFLSLAFLATAAFFALDASREREWAPSAALLVTLGGAGVTIAYAFEAGPEYYAAGLAAVGLACGFGGRVWSPAWLDERARDQAAVAAVTIAWLPFEGVYEDNLRFGAAVHFAAAVLYTGAALVDRSKLTLGELLNTTTPLPVRVGSGWLYVAGLTIVIGYLDILRSLPAAEGEGAGSLALPVMGLSLGFLVAGAVFRWVRADLRMHVYIIALLTGLFALSISKDAVTLAAILSVFVFAYAAIAAWENSPLLAAPAAVFGFAAVIAWRQELDWPLYSVPLAYSAIAFAVYAAGFALRPALRAWSDALRAAGAAFALASPAVGFGILASDTKAGLYRGEEFETSALYEWSTLATGLVGLLALAESSIARRGWVVVAGSAVMLVAVLLQIARFQPDNIQAYTAVIGAYLVLLGLIGLSRYRLIPGLEETAVYIEALGAVIVMFPSFLQSIDGGWRYEVILLIEAAGFFTAGVALQRRGLLGTALGGLVLVGGRVLFDAINALPNWIVALIIGMALLFVGLGIMISRDRWTRWEERIASWWKEPPGGRGQEPPRLRPGAPGA